jgi:Asp/Glu/hydantoin racemase
MAAPTAAGDKPKSILIINPNTTQAMTDALRPLIDSLNIKDVSLKHIDRLQRPHSAI